MFDCLVGPSTLLLAPPSVFVRPHGPPATSILALSVISLPLNNLIFGHILLPHRRRWIPHCANCFFAIPGYS